MNLLTWMTKYRKMKRGVTYKRQKRRSLRTRNRKFKKIVKKGGVSLGNEPWRDDLMGTVFVVDQDGTSNLTKEQMANTLSYTTPIDIRYKEIGNNRDNKVIQITKFSSRSIFEDVKSTGNYTIKQLDNGRYMIYEAPGGFYIRGNDGKYYALIEIQLNRYVPSSH